MKETFEYMKKEKQERRRKNMNKRFEFLEQTDLDYKILNKEIGHIRVDYDKKIIDCWISSCKWTILKSNKYNEGWLGFLNQVNLKYEYLVWCEKNAH